MKSNSGLIMKYFVLKPEGDSLYHKASREAILTYAATVREDNPVLADDLVNWVHELRKDSDGSK